MGSDPVRQDSFCDPRSLHRAWPGRGFRAGWWCWRHLEPNAKVWGREKHHRHRRLRHRVHLSEHARRPPIDILKIDRSFVSGQPSATPSVPMLEGILGMAKKLSLEVIAEGIEQPEQLTMLRNLGCRLGQGYLLARPTPAQALESMLATGGLLQVTFSSRRGVRGRQPQRGPEDVRIGVGRRGTWQRS